MKNLSDTIAGGRQIKVTFEDGSERTINVRQLPVRDYPKAFLLVEDEISLNAFVAVLTVDEAGSLQPSSYEQLNTATQEVNKAGFFVYAARMTARNLAVFNGLPPEVQRATLAGGASTTPSLLPSSPPRRG